ncbi:hypothetical protein AVEN_2226-1 [Araneus ventricosus]|uniref:IGFBP N-terminal domain-containing protein n=1 Tax=Araneus ventricosus TaxID=182803 RepID=A0A4Y2P3C6_ARAVE|nr:hypothetical protein AVEN_2226-1 [Araneus ventricosus]
MKKTIVLLLIGATVSNAIVCVPNYCDSVTCELVQCASNQKYKEGGSFCGCCPTCLTIIQEGGSCGSLFIRGMPPTITCAEGLRCDSDTETCQ